MLFDDNILIPNRLIDSLEDDQLVIFAGAGVSMDPPADLPDFKSLTQEIAGTEEVSEPYDKTLGALAKDGQNVHREAKNILDRQSPSHNDLHERLVKLFDRPTDLRIVTTNYDTLLEEACQEVFGESPNVYEAPALPKGSDFSGVVHLHGSLENRCDRLVLTDRDFSRAYLTEGWARRFLVEMFDEFDILFVGYRYGDVVLKYLARGLPPAPERKRFAFVPEPDAQDGDHDKTDWDLLDIESIEYSPADDHAQLGRIVADWVADRRRGASAVRSRMQQILGGSYSTGDEAEDWRASPSNATNDPGPLSPEEREYLKAKISTSVGIDAFCEFAKAEWAGWLDENDKLGDILNGRNLSHEQQRLQKWLARAAVEQPSPVFSVIDDHGGRLTPRLAEAVLHALALSNADTDALTAWIPFLTAETDAVRERTSSALHIFEHSLECDVPEHAWLIVEELLEPTFHSSRGRPRLDIWRRNTGYVLDKCLKEFLESEDPSIRSRLWRVLFDAMRRYHRIATATGEAPLGSTRSAIEPNPANGPATGDLDLVIDALRELLEKTPSVTTKTSRIDDLLDSGIPLLERIGLHGLRDTQEISAEEILNLVLEREWLFDKFRRHEVFLLLQEAFEHPTDNMWTLLLETVENHEDETGSPIFTARQKFRVLQWLDEVKPDDRELRKHFDSLRDEFLQEIRDEFPEFEPEDDPSLRVDYGVTVSGSGQQANKSVGEFRDMTLDEILSYFRQPVEGGAFSQWARDDDAYNLGEAIAEEPEIGLELARNLQSQSSSQLEGIGGPILRGWREDLPGEELTGEILEVLANWEPTSDMCIDAARFMHTLAKERPEMVFSDYLSESHTIAENIWNFGEETRDAIEDWYGAAINSTSGVITRFWMLQLDYLIGDAEEPEPDSKNLLSILEEMQTGDEQEHRLVRTILGANIDFLLHVNREWLTDEIIPNLQKEALPAVDRPTWHGVAATPRISQELAETCGAEYQRLIPHLGEMPGRARRGLLHQLALLLVHFVDNPVSDWAFPILQKTGADDRTYFVQRLCVIICELEPEHQRAAWEDWLAELWRRRQNNIPVETEPDELAEWLNFCVKCPHLFPLLVDHLEDWEGPVDISTLRLCLIGPDHDRIDRTPETARFLAEIARIARGQTQQHCGLLNHQLEKLVDAGVTGPEVQLFRDRLLDMGCSGASRIEIPEEESVST